MTTSTPSTLTAAPLASAPVPARIPGDKSLAIRALLLSLLADGPCVVRGIEAGHISAHTLAALQTLGADVVVSDDGVRCAHIIPPPSLRPGQRIDCGGSATLARILMGLLSGAGVDAELVGSPMLSRRPMARVAAPLCAYFGRDVVSTDTGTLPVRVAAGAGPVAVGADDVIRPGDSAQVRAALFFAAVAARAPLRLWSERPGRRHSEQLLRLVGVDVVDSDNVVIAGARRPRGTRAECGGPVRAFDFTVPADPSQAAFVWALAAGARGHGAVVVDDVIVDVERAGFLRCLQRMGCVVTETQRRERAGLCTATVAVAPPRSSFNGIVVDADEIPDLVDEVPVLMALCAVASSPPTRLGLAELRFKASDRVERMRALLQALGAHVDVRGDDVVVHPPANGRLRCPQTPIVTHRDHRIAMAAMVLSRFTDNAHALRLDDDDAVAESWPGARDIFDDVWARLSDAAAAGSASKSSGSDTRV